MTRRHLNNRVPRHKRVSKRERDARALAFAATLLQRALAGGHTVVGVFPVEGGGVSYHFAYTVGRCLRGWPELIATGVSNLGDALLNWVDAHWDAHPGPGVRWPVSEGAIMTVPVPEDQRDDHLTMVQSLRFGPGVPAGWSALQVVWRTDAGLWPWDLSDPTLPVLAGPDWRPA